MFLHQSIEPGAAVFVLPTRTLQHLLHDRRFAFPVFHFRLHSQKQRFSQLEILEVEISLVLSCGWKPAFLLVLLFSGGVEISSFICKFSGCGRDVFEVLLV